MSKKIVIATGGSGGHLIPAQLLAEQLESAVTVLFGGYKLSTSPYFNRDRFAYKEILSSPTVRKPWALLKGVAQALLFLRKENPDVVVGFGSFHSAPLLVAAVILRKKIMLYEANRTMGKVNRWIAPFAKLVGLQFPIPAYSKAKFVLVTLPKKETTLTRQEARKGYGLDPELFTILVFGGSQGAAFLNEIMPKVAQQLPNTQVIHFAGNEAAGENVRRDYINNSVHNSVVKAFEDNMSKAYSAADFVVGRSGAGTIAELLQHGKPSLLIPYPYSADHHQQKNAEYLRELGGAVVLAQDKANVHSIVTSIQSANSEAMQLALRTAASQTNVSNDLTQLVLQHAN